MTAPAVTVTGRGEVGYAKARMTHFTPVVRLLAVCSNHDCYFLENAINNHKVVVESTGVPQLTVPQLSSYNIFFPANGKEEVRIGKYFHTLDNLITLHQRECNQLKELKKTMLKKMFPRDGSNIPEVRFAGFTDDWEQRKLRDEAIEILAGGDINKEKTVENGKYPIYANALTNDGIVGYYDDYYRVTAPAVTVTGRGEVGYAKARMTHFTPVVRLLAVCSNHDCYFLENAINNHKVVVESTGVPQLTVPQLSSYNIFFPANGKEEVRIGKYFHTLDNLITLHQRECNQLKELKKTMLKKMFPRDGSNIPEVRFAGFTDDWEQRKLGDVTQIIMGQSPDGSTYSETPKDYILVQGNSDIKDGWVEPRLWTTQVTKKADVGDLIMSVRAPAGSMGKTAYNVVIGRGVAAIKGNEFIFQSLIKKDIEGFWKKITTGSTFESLNSNDIKNSNLLVPVNEEQIKIGQYFSQLDNLITLHQRL